MSKLNAPLLSFGASGKIADSLVFFNWKGLNVARKYVVPSNPKTTLQIAQRAHLTWAVTQIHSVEADAAHPMNAADKEAYALLGSTFPTPRTWFNAICKMCIDQRVAGKSGGVYFYSEQSGTATTHSLNLWYVGSNNPTAPKIFWGSSKTALINSANCLILAGDHFGGDMTGLVTKTKYYCQIRGTSPAAVVGTNSGIYHFTTP